MTDEPDTRTQRERMLAGDLYIADDPELGAASRRAMRLQAEYAQTWPFDHGAAMAILGELLGTLGARCEVRPPLYVDYGSYLHLGDRVFVNYNLQAADVAAIRIGDNTQIGPNVSLLTPTHPLDPQLRLDRWEAAKPITIGANVWIGGGAIVLPGVTVGDHSVIGAGAVVTRDVPERVLVLGNPARVVKQL
jgi:maltose O-acetyltransferase